MKSSIVLGMFTREKLRAAAGRRTERPYYYGVKFVSSAGQDTRYACSVAFESRQLSIVTILLGAGKENHKF